MWILEGCEDNQKRIVGDDKYRKVIHLFSTPKAPFKYPES